MMMITNGMLTTTTLRCDGRVTCNIAAENDVFGADPCPSTYKYLDVHYICEKGRFSLNSLLEKKKNVSLSSRAGSIILTYMDGHMYSHVDKCINVC